MDKTIVFIDEGFLSKLTQTFKLIGLIMMPEENESNNFILFINDKFKDEILENVNSSFSCQIILKGFVMSGIDNDFIYFVVKDFSENSIFFSSFVNLFFTKSGENEFVIHFEFNSLKNSSAELYTLPVVSFNAFFNSLMCSDFIGSSSTGCQSILSQNSQSSSVISLVCLNLVDMSCFINRITALETNLKSNSVSGEVINSVINGNNCEDYLKLSNPIKRILVKNEK